MQTAKRKIIDEDNLRDLWDNIRHTNTHIREVTEGKDRNWQKTFEEIMVENFPDLKEEIGIYSRKHRESQTG